MLHQVCYHVTPSVLSRYTKLLSRYTEYVVLHQVHCHVTQCVLLLHQVCYHVTPGVLSRYTGLLSCYTKCVIILRRVCCCVTQSVVVLHSVLCCYREKMIRLQHENKMLRVQQSDRESEQGQLLQNQLDDANTRKNELESEVR